MRSSTATRLDNPVWHALEGPHRAFGEGDRLARRFDPEVAPFAALPDAVAPESWDALRTLAGPGRVVALFRRDLPAREGWEVAVRMPCHQMVCDRLREHPEAGGVAPLGPSDVADMRALVERTQPGPFFGRTHELGRFLGVREQGELIAMAGERLRIDGATEISAVCTDPRHRRRGLAAALVAAAATAVHARGETAFLHVLHDNTAAIRVYAALGFATRADIDVVGLRAPR